ncbi:DUF4351 domain-containing protein [Ferrovum sp.]|uniref:DUF4351 domain-containing protein n=1 Tax=Ferrovum sp. TaxID=2609467 RepID=UPI002633DDC5|nr:DUF4351 domain-containing protein [Ferrovum sp.]
MAQEQAQSTRLFVGDVPGGAGIVGGMTHEHDSSYKYLFSVPEMVRDLRWIRATLMRKPGYRILLPEVENLQGVRIMLSEQLEVWARQYEAEGVQKGMQQGMQQGEALALQKLLTKRFGVIPPGILARIASASQDQVEAWFDVAIEASGYTEVFGPITH